MIGSNQEANGETHAPEGNENKKHQDTTDKIEKQLHCYYNQQSSLMILKPGFHIVVAIVVCLCLSYNCCRDRPTIELYTTAFCVVIQGCGPTVRSHTIGTSFYVCI